jgi:signal transduction histidine kinase
MSLETEELLNRQVSLARIAGAIAHELNNPLQGVLSLVTVSRSEAIGDDRARWEQIQDGLLRLSHVIQSLSAVYENLPRLPEQVTAGDFLDLLVAAFDERKIQTEVFVSLPRDVSFDAMTPELVRLIREAFSLPLPTSGCIRIDMSRQEGRVVLVCERQSLDAAEPWCGLIDHHVCSGLAVLIDEMTKLAGGEPEFRFDHASLSGIRLCFRTRMN